MGTHQLSQPEIGFIDPERTEESDGSSLISDIKYAAFKSQDAMDAFLLGNGYSAAAISALTTNDKIFAIQSVTDPQPPVLVPVVDAIVPPSAPVGAQVTILGSNLVGTTSVTFNGTAAEMTAAIVSNEYVAVEVPIGATTGFAVVTAPGGTDSEIFIVG